jgi:hypothetical protein
MFYESVFHREKPKAGLRVSKIKYASVRITYRIEYNIAGAGTAHLVHKEKIFGTMFLTYKKRI